MNASNMYCYGTTQLRTTFSKVRVIIVRLKNKKYKENIDCADFTFSKSEGGIMI